MKGDEALVGLGTTVFFLPRIIRTIRVATKGREQINATAIRASPFLTALEIFVQAEHLNFLSYFFLFYSFDRSFTLLIVSSRIVIATLN